MISLTIQPMHTKGFTLIELLVVITIIGILSGVVLASISGARAKARDSERVSEIGQLRLAISIYYDNNGAYPLTLNDLVTASSIPSVPADPSGSAYTYRAAAGCNNYLLAAPAFEVTAYLPQDDVDGNRNICSTGSVNCNDPVYCTGVY